MSEGAQRWTGILDRADWRRMAIETADATRLENGQIEARIERLAITANTVTYAVLGDRMHYWKFFPTDLGRGIVPAWGTAVVERSRHEKVPVGTRLYGIWPTASHGLLLPNVVDKQHVNEGSSHRQPLFPIYNRYERLKGSSQHDDLLCTFRPLLVTAAMLQDALADRRFHDAEQVVLSSASSKTAMLSAFCLARGTPRPARIVGLTATPNLEFVRGLGLYDAVIDYDAIETLPVGIASVLLDFAGNGDLIARVHQHFGDALKYSSQVGKSHWSATTTATPGLPGPRPELFFAPAQIAKRTQNWGQAGFSRHIGAAWKAVIERAHAWTQVREHAGPRGLAEAWSAMVAGRVAASDTLVVRL